MKKLYIGLITGAVALSMFAAGIFVGNVVKNKGNKAVRPDVAVNGSEVTGVNSEAEYIGKETAKQIALERAELKEADVSFVRVEFERDNGIYIYDVDFRKGNMEYSAEIKADDGKIIDWDVDIDD